MYVFKSNTPGGVDEILSKPSKNSTTLQKGPEGVLARVQAPVVPAQVAVLNDAVAPTGTVLGNIFDAVVLAGVVSTIGQPVAGDYAREAANQAKALQDEAIAQNALQVLANTPNTILPISSLSDGAAPLTQAPVDLNLPMSKLNPTYQIVDLSDAFLSTQVTAPTLINDLSSGDASITVIDGAKDNVHITDFEPTQTISETFINTGLGKLTIITPATNVATLTLSGEVEFTATGMEVTSGITVSGASDSSNVILYITGGASRASASVDQIQLGDGNNVVFNAGDGTILMELGSGSNTVVLSGMGVSGTIQFAAHNNAISDTVAIAPSDFASFEQFGTIPLVTITGLNIHANSSDKISFLGDIGSELSWAGGSAQNAQVSMVSGDATALANWINAAQTVASTAHSIAWFHFDGATYILESVGDLHASNVGDTLIKLTGTVTFTGVDGALSTGMLNLVG